MAGGEGLDGGLWSTVLIELLLHPPFLVRGSPQTALQRQQAEKRSHKFLVILRRFTENNSTVLTDLCGFLLGQYFMENQ